MRNFRDFLPAYAAWAKDNYCPDKFHFWTGASILAAALERKVWTAQGKTQHYPNLFLMLVAAPGDGKSTAGDRGVSLLREVAGPEGSINYIPPKITDAALHQAMTRTKRFFVGAQEYSHNSSYYFASEASNGLREIPGGGDIFPTITEAYDCKNMHKQLANKPPMDIKNTCMNVLACSTFNALEGMLTEGGIMGGFASRFLYVVSDEQIIRTPSFDAPEDGDGDEERFRLIADLQHIYQLTGRFAVSPDFKRTFEKWFPKNDVERYSRDSEKEQSFLARKHTAIIKLAMIFSVSESSELRLEQKHWEQALALVESLETKFDRIIEVTHRANTQDGVDGLILSQVRRAGGVIAESLLLKNTSRRGNDRELITKTVRSMVSESAQLERVMIGGASHLRILAKE